jgi:bacterioferritin (cytochrome b1)
MTRSHQDSRALSGELVALLRLTRAEAQTARIRVSQARDENIRRELQDNAEAADLRALGIQEALRRVGGTPDVVGDALGRVVALTKATTEQLQPFSEGLLGDLALEHQLRDRVVFTRVLAETQDQPAVASLMKDLEAAHSETIDWIRVRLAELAQGGPVALSPTPPQAAASALARFATLPSRQTAALVNKAADVLRRGGNKAKQSADSAVRRVQENVEATGEVIEAGRDAALERAEQVAPTADGREAARGARESLGTVDADTLPINGYDTLSSADVVRRIKDLTSSDDLRVVLRYEEAHKNRKGATSAAQARLTELAEESVTA